MEIIKGWAESRSSGEGVVRRCIRDQVIPFKMLIGTADPAVRGKEIIIIEDYSPGYPGERQIRSSNQPHIISSGGGFIGPVPAIRQKIGLPFAPDWKVFAEIRERKNKA